MWYLAINMARSNWPVLCVVTWVTFWGTVRVYMVNARYGCLVIIVSVGFVVDGVVIVCKESVSYVFNVGNFVSVVEVLIVVVHVVISHDYYFFIFIMCLLLFILY